MHELMIVQQPTIEMENVLEDQDNFLTDLYERTFPAVAKFVRSQNGSFQEARDIFHDAMIIYYEKLQGNQREIKLSEQAYLVGIAKHLWFRKYKDARKFISLSEKEEEITIPENFFPDAKTDRLLSFLEFAGKKCMEMLQQFYYQGATVSDIVKRFGFSSVRSATVQKFKCLEKIRNHVKEKSLHYEDFTE